MSKLVTAKFQKTRPKDMRNGRHLKNRKIRDKCMTVRLGWTDCSKAWVD